MLHHNPSENTVFGRIFYAQRTKTSRNPAQNREKERFFPSEFRDFSDFGHSYPVIEVYEFLNAATDADCSSDVVGQGGEGKLGSDLFLTLQSMKDFFCPVRCAHRVNLFQTILSKGLMIVAFKDSVILKESRFTFSQSCDKIDSEKVDLVFLGKR